MKSAGHEGQTDPSTALTLRTPVHPGKVTNRPAAGAGQEASLGLLVDSSQTPSHRAAEMTEVLGPATPEGLFGHVSQKTFF